MDGASAAYVARDTLGAARSADGQTGWSYVNQGLNNTQLNAIVADAGGSLGLFVATVGAGVYHSTDGGELGTRGTGGLPLHRRRGYLHRPPGRKLVLDPDPGSRPRAPGAHLGWRRNVDGLDDADPVPQR
jgi:hypothetical protein